MTMMTMMMMMTMTMMIMMKMLDHDNVRSKTSLEEKINVLHELNK